MNRPLRDRLTALLAAVLFLLSGAGDAFGAHPCPHHAAIGVPSAVAAAAAASAPDAAHHGHAAHSPAAPAEHDGHDACTCVDGVCPVVMGPAPLPAPGFGHLPVLAVAPVPAARAGDATLPARLLPHFLPFAQAPPSRA